MLAVEAQGHEILTVEWLQSNICRCTSYQEIRDAVKLMYDDTLSNGASK